MNNDTFDYSLGYWKVIEQIEQKYRQERQEQEETAKREKLAKLAKKRELDFEISINSTGDGVIINKYKGNEKDVIIPKEIKGYPVTEIGERAFFKPLFFTMLSVSVPEGVTTIGREAFLGCMKLISVSLPPTVSSIGDNAFSRCKNISLNIQSQIRNMGYKGSFYD